MTVTTGYLYAQKHTAVITDTGVSNLMSMFYTPTVKVYRGIDNYIRIEFKNRDQKRVNMSGKTANIVVLDKENNVAYLERALTVVNEQKGIMEASVTQGDLLNLDSKFYNYALKVTDGEDRTAPAYADDNYGANGVLEVADGVYPTFIASTTEAFASGDTGSTISIKPYINRNTAQHTAQVYFSSAFTGTLEIQGSINPSNSIQNADFTTIATETYTAQTDNAYVNFTGVYSAVRFKRTTTSGTLSQVLYRP
tara:strand:- start:6142 stop:6897 length:756 start_codon:yes stop_codon:yes gene_type:complete